jgi:hypothetical protein
MMTTLLAVALSNGALAQTAEMSSGNAEFLIGAGALPGSGDPETFVLGFRGEVPVATGDVLGVGVVIPLELASSGDDGIGWQAQNTAFEVAPSIRGRIAPDGVVRVYGDLGFGLVHRFSETDTWFGTVNNNRTTLMARSALGLEIGGREPGDVALVLEPIGYRHYGLDGDGADRFVMMAGIQVGL